MGVNPMTATPASSNLRVSYSFLGLILLCCGTAGSAQEAPIVQPGAPGKPTRELSADQAIEIAVTQYSPADVRFMHDMIPHHHQAIEMAELVADRTNRKELIDVAGRIDASQAEPVKLLGHHRYKDLDGALV